MACHLPLILSGLALAIALNERRHRLASQRESRQLIGVIRDRVEARAGADEAVSAARAQVVEVAAAVPTMPGYVRWIREDWMTVFRPEVRS